MGTIDERMTRAEWDEHWFESGKRRSQPRSGRFPLLDAMPSPTGATRILMSYRRIVGPDGKEIVQDEQEGQIPYARSCRESSGPAIVRDADFKVSYFDGSQPHLWLPDERVHGRFVETRHQDETLMFTTGSYETAFRAARQAARYDIKELFVYFGGPEGLGFVDEGSPLVKEGRVIVPTTLITCPCVADHPDVQDSVQRMDLGQIVTDCKHKAGMPLIVKFVQSGMADYLKVRRQSGQSQY